MAERHRREFRCKSTPSLRHRTPLTTGIDTGALFTGTAGNDTFNAFDGLVGTTVTPTFSAFDSIDGGAGSNTLNIIQSAAFVAVPTASVKNIQTVSIKAASNVTADTTTWTGLTALNVASVGDAIVTAGAATNLTVTSSDLQVGAGLAGNDLTVNGGNNVTTTSTDSVTGGAGITSSVIAIGGTTAAKGDVSVTHTETVADNATPGASTSATATITVTGGKAITVASNATVGAAENVGDIATIGLITVNGNADTTSVSVTQSAATATFDGTTNKNTKIVNGVVTIADANLATVSDTLTTVTLNNFGASTIASNVLNTLNIKGGATLALASGSLGLNITAADTSTVATTLALNGAGGFVGAISGTQAAKYTTVNVASTAATTIADVTFGAATALNFSGAGVTTLTANTGIALAKTITSTGAGVTLGTTLANDVVFTGGAGAETISLGATTKAISMGDGNDTVTITAAITAATASVTGGNGTDTLVMTDTLAQDLSATSAFNAKVSGFDAVTITAAAGTKTIDLGALNNVTTVNTAGVTALTINGMATGGTLNLTGASTSETVNITSAVGGIADVLNLNLAKTAAGVVAYGTVTAANVETINITSFDKVAAGSAAAIDTLILAAAGATSVVVTGNNGLTLTNTNNIAITNFDASGIVANGTALVDTAANLAVTFTSANTTATANVAIKGGAGNDVLTGGVSKDTIIGGAGNDALYGDNTATKTAFATADVATTATGVTTLTASFMGLTTAATTVTMAGANPTDIEIGNAIRSAVNTDAVLSKLIVATGAGKAVVFTSLIDGTDVTLPTVTITAAGGTATYAAGAATAGTANTSAVDTLNGGDGADVLVGGGAADTLTGGAGIDNFFFLKGHSVLSAMATITDFTFATGGASNDKIIIGDQVAVIGTTLTVQDLSTAVSIQAAMDAAATTNIVNNGLSVFIWGGNEYAFVETTGAGTSYVTSDFVVKLTGLPLAAAATIAGSGFDAV